MDELALIHAAKAHEPGSGAFLVSAYGPQLARYCAALASDMSDVDREMICEQAIEIAVRKIDEYDENVASFASWLRGFVRNTVLNWRRSHGLRHPDSADELSLIDAPTPARRPSPLLPELRRAVQALPEEDQTYLVLRYRDGLPTKDIAQLVNKTDDAVRKRLSRIHARLRTSFDA